MTSDVIEVCYHAIWQAGPGEVAAEAVGKTLPVHWFFLRPGAFRAGQAAQSQGGLISYTENELPQPQLPVAFGLLNVNPEPITEFT